MAYVFEQPRKDGPAFTAMYKGENGRYRSAGTYETQKRALEVAECFMSTGTQDAWHAKADGHQTPRSC